MRCDYCQREFKGDAIKMPDGLVACSPVCRDALQHFALENALAESAKIKMTRPTPNGLADAIRHGINLETGADVNERCALAKYVAPYVSEWLAERFCAYMLREKDPRVLLLLRDLYDDCVRSK